MDLSSSAGTVRGEAVSWLKGKTARWWLAVMLDAIGDGDSDPDVMLQKVTRRIDG